jgi:hypothetical protein
MKEMDKLNKLINENIGQKTENHVKIHNT